MAKRSFYVKDSELDDYQVKVINKKTDNMIIEIIANLTKIFRTSFRPWPDNWCIDRGVS